MDRHGVTYMTQTYNRYVMGQSTLNSRATASLGMSSHFNHSIHILFPISNDSYRVLRNLHKVSQ